jgi:hypothetical protein
VPVLLGGGRISPGGGGFFMVTDLVGDGVDALV